VKRVLAALLLVPSATACSSDDEQTLTVLAAASLTETFAELAEQFEADHTGVQVELVLGSSTALAEQAVDGAPGQVLATADEHSIQTAEDGNALADAPDAFASNTLTVVTPPDNPAGIASLADLASDDVDFVMCAESAPCGAIAADLLRSTGIAAEPASEEVDVKGVLARVTQGEADAGLVYRTDAVAAGDAVAEVEVPEAADLSTNYFIAPLEGADGDLADLAAEFVTLVRSDEAREVLEGAGFGGVVRQ
jgi:molybdate transport system substrate-binding protein